MSTTTEFAKGFAAGWKAALCGFDMDSAYTGSYGAGYRAGWRAATS